MVLLRADGRAKHTAGWHLVPYTQDVSQAESLAPRRAYVAVRGRAGFTTGAIYRSTRGPRSAAVAGAVGAVAASALVFARKTLNKNL